MLAAKRSFGNLRVAAARSSSQPAASLPSSSHFVIPQQQHQSPSHSRTLVSAVLLSRDQFEKKTVKQLQEELGERGLSTRGKKAALVDRLLENVSRNPPPSIVSSSSSPAASLNSSSRFSTTSTSQYATKASTTAKSTSKSTEAEAAPVSPQVNAEEGKVFTPSPVQPGSEPPSSGEESKKDGKPVITAAPGLVIDKAEDEKLAATAGDAPGGTIEIPESATNTGEDAVFLPSTSYGAVEGDGLTEAMIPSFPDQYKNPEGHDPFTQPFTMHPSWIKSQVHTVDGEQSAVHHQASNSMPTDDPESRTSEPRKEFQYAPDTTMVEEAFATLGIKAKRASKSAKKQSNSVLKVLQNEFGFPSDKAIEEATEVANKAASNTPNGGKEVQYKFQDRELHNDERSGLYVLLGIVAGGLALGGLGKSTQEKEEAHDDKSQKH